MKQGNRVKTIYGNGTIIEREAEIGFLADRFLVKLDSCPDKFQYMHKAYGGIYIYKKELEVIE